MSAVPRPGAELIRLALQRAGRMRFRARGGSMQPGLRDADVVSVVPADAADLRVGDVICYETGRGRLAVHRLVGREGDCLVTRGDALSWAEHVPAERLLGKVASVERDDGRSGALGRRLRRRWSMLWHA